MYIALLLLLFFTSASLVLRGSRDRRGRMVALGVLVLLGTVALFGGMSLASELWWFEALGFGDRFWRAIGYQVGLGAAGAALGVGVVWALTAPLEDGGTRVWPEVLGGAAGAFLGWASWGDVALLFSRVDVGLVDPILGLDVGFYLFVLPVVDVLLLAIVWWLGIAAAALLVSWSTARRPPSSALLVQAAAAGVVVAFALVRGVFHLLYSEWGVVAGPGWTDVHVRLPAMSALAFLSLVASALVLTPAMRKVVLRRVPTDRSVDPEGAFTTAAVVGAGLVSLLVLGLLVLPALVQWLVVQPTELAYEAPYIRNNIAFTREAFGLADVEGREFPALSDVDADLVADNRGVLDEVRLWDWRALDEVYAQFQEFRLYYEFLDVDVDRYRIGDDVRQVMVSARELDQRNLPAQGQTFVNQVFKYTHGYGITLSPVHDFADDGLPDLLVRDIPPRSAFPELAVDRPEIYFGELGGPVVVGSDAPEFDYPSGEDNVYAHYEGLGGVRLANAWRRLVYGWTLFGTRFLLSAYPTDDSRILYHRPVRERVARIAPFLRLDADPYVVLAEGRLYWIQDAYTVSDGYPYSEPFSGVEAAPGGARVVVPWLAGANYLRNSVKAVVDAYEGTVTLYVFEPDDPLIRAWSRVFPDLFTPMDEMPPELRAHVRYPADQLLVQGLVFAKYHMDDPVVFYNQEDLWVRATEQFYGKTQLVDPYYVMWKQNGRERPEFSLILPFTPKNRQVAVGWIAGLADGEDYGKLLAYRFPKDQRVVGPQQVETKIDQDPVLSARLSLWDQRGSRVLRGNVLAIPIGESLLYVEPIYLRAETAAFPELRLVVLMTGDHMVYAETFDEALALLVGAAEPPLDGVEAPAASDLGAEADRLFRRYLSEQGEGRFEDAGATLKQLSDVLGELAGS